ncbi:uncharacterized protein RHO25_011359 [Cercospora beticola]|uniref:Uncharacterized protein n=1 Tax=Cercospora beticola TaxID=122368 RepID=A0ABZ0P4I2_CERBT|nr:hypothetical protein RHO25_011359 [Cercospora beticola]
MAESNLYHYGHGMKPPQFGSGHTAPPAQIVLPYENLVILLLICGAFGILAAISRFIGFMTSRHIAFGRLEENLQNENASFSAESEIANVNNKDDNSGSGSCPQILAKQQGPEKYTMETSSRPSEPSASSSSRFRKTLTCEFWVASGLLIYVILTIVFRRTIFVQGGGPKAIAKAAAVALGIVSATDGLLIGWCWAVEGVKGKIVR